MHGFYMTECMETEQMMGGVAARVRRLIDEHIKPQACCSADADVVRVQIIRHARTHSVGKSQSCMFSGMVPFVIS